METVLAFLAALIVATISGAGYFGIAMLMAIESACIPLPSEIIMPFAGYLVSTGELNLLVVATAGAVGCNLGSIGAYAIGAYGGRRFIERWGRYVLLSHHDLSMAEAFFRRYGAMAVLVGRLLPVVRTFIALPAGIARMPLLRFHVYTFVGSWPWCYGLAYIGMKLGAKWNSDPRFRDIMHRFDALILFAAIIVVAWYVWSHWKNRGTSAEK